MSPKEVERLRRLGELRDTRREIRFCHISSALLAGFFITNGYSIMFWIMLVIGLIECVLLTAINGRLDRLTHQFIKEHLP